MTFAGTSANGQDAPIPDLRPLQGGGFTNGAAGHHDVMASTAAIRVGAWKTFRMCPSGLKAGRKALPRNRLGDGSGKF